MSAMSMRKLSLDHPEHSKVGEWGRYDIIRIEPSFSINHKIKVIKLRNDDILNIDTPHYCMGSVVSSCIEYGTCPIKGWNRAIENGHATHFITKLGVSITAHKQSRRQAIDVEWGQLVEFEGRLFTIEKANNENAKLVEMVVEHPEEEA